MYTQSEVNDINKQRFLPELGKLLTFMVEQDRQTALAMYSRLFDDAEDEQKLMDLLVSPTRQAVVIARTYDAKARKQQLESGSPAADETPAFVLAIDKIYQEVAPEHVNRPAEEIEPAALINPLINQFSLFSDDAHPIDDSEYVPFKIEADAVSIEEPVEALPIEPETEEEAPLPEEPAPEAEPAAPEQPVQELPAEEERAVPAEPEAVPVPPVEVEAVPAQAPEAVPVQVPEAVPVQAPEAVPAPEEPTVYAPAPVELSFIPETRRKPRVFLLILYVLFAVPLTAVCILLLLIPTVLALTLAVGVIIGGSFLFMSAFSGFPKLADILIVLGTSVVVLALGLLLLWLFVWFVGGVIGGLIRGVVNLGRKWCYKEVAA